ncbi:flavin monoamine oxidase family protein [Amorphus coralli]|uniref:flavin monoamine oxidase family protein n=1 Tax=Amorphus coralli TaxID=340680 RepID=UPI000413C23A|nr:NAD(P)/FAD-dependent oxidoreductase [Amorphus coralli]
MVAGPLARAAGAAPHVIVIGAGFAGLSCAFQLLQAGARVTVLEARNRVGGRVLSLDGFIEGRVVEGGAELIGSNHPNWMAYSELFGLEFRDVTELEEEAAPILLNGRRYEGADLVSLWDRLQQTLDRMNADARTVTLDAPWKTPNAARLDSTSVASAFASWPVDDAARHAALTLLANDNASWPERDSYLGAISAIAGGGHERFWLDSEVYRCIGGNQTLAFKLAEAIGQDRVHLGAPVARIRLTGSGAAVDRADGQTVEGDAVVLTVPPSAWETFETDPVLPAGVQPTTGPAVKYLSRVSRPFWRQSGVQPNSLTDTPVGETWEGTDGQGGTVEQPACLSVFSGGQAAQDCLDFEPASRDEEMKAYLEAIYPGYSAHVERTMFMGWPNEKWTQCGYSCPAVGEVTSIYPNLEAGFENRLFFAGEYTSLLFTGYMEGALHSGARLARKLAGRFNLPTR